MRKIAIGNALAGIANAQNRVAVARVELDPDAAAARRMPQRVVDQVDEHLREAVGVGLDAHRAKRRQLDRNALV